MRTKLSQFKFDINEKLIARTPSKRRDDSRLMVVDRATGNIEHKQFTDLLDYYDEGDSLVFNKTKVFPARLYGLKDKTQARIEVYL
ncbi:MAG: S-adenosylmethionine:tRNA ribosyltransferase-isomerase, partial [Bacteroidota bacterium]